MRLKTFTAKTTAKAMDLVRKELGDEAIIVSTMEDKNAGYVRVVAAQEEIDHGHLLSTLPKNNHESFNTLEIICACLDHHGVPSELRKRIISSLPESIHKDALEPFAQALEACISFGEFDLATQNRPLVLIGPPGVGKTASIAKLAAQAKLLGRKLHLMTADTIKAGGIEQLETFANAMDEELCTMKKNILFNTALLILCLTLSCADLIASTANGDDPKLSVAYWEREIKAQLKKSDESKVNFGWWKITDEQMVFVSQALNNVGSNIKDLSLVANKLTTLPQGFGTGLRNLERLGFDSNELASLPDDFGQGMENLRYLSLGYNKLESLPDTFGKDMRKLERLQLHYNKLTSLPDDFGKDMESLENLLLYRNNLMLLPENFGVGLSNLRGLYLYSNYQLASLPDNFGQGLDNLENLHLSHNQLTELPDNFGHNLKHLKWLGLAHNKLSTLPDNFGHGLNELTRLDLLGNDYIVISYNMLSRMPKLTCLFLPNKPSGCMVQ